VQNISGVNVPGTGFGLGFDRTLEALEEFNLIPKLKTASKALVTIFTPETVDESINVSKTLRESGINTELYPNETVRLDKQLKYADKKGIPYVIIIGPEEVKDKKILLKNLKTGEQIKTNIENLISLLK